MTAKLISCRSDLRDERPVDNNGGHVVGEIRRAQQPGLPCTATTRPTLLPLLQVAFGILPTREGELSPASLLLVLSITTRMPFLPWFRARRSVLRLRGPIGATSRQLSSTEFPSAVVMRTVSSALSTRPTVVAFSCASCPWRTRSRAPESPRRSQSRTLSQLKRLGRK